MNLSVLSVGDVRCRRNGEKPIHTIADRRLIREMAMLLELDPGMVRLLNRSGDSASYCVATSSTAYNSDWICCRQFDRDSTPLLTQVTTASTSFHAKSFESASHRLLLKEACPGAALVTRMARRTSYCNVRSILTVSFRFRTCFCCWVLELSNCTVKWHFPIRLASANFFHFQPFRQPSCT
jgi:hypothetical protein